MGELTIGSFPSLVGSMTLDFTFKLAEAAIAKGHHVNLWLSGNAVMMAKKGQKPFKDYSHVQKRMNELMAKGDARARKIYETIGVYFGYAIAQYADFYDLKHLLVLGRVLTGEGGNLILGRASQVLKDEFPEVAERVGLHVPSEKGKRHGQAIAAASLPATS